MIPDRVTADSEADVPRSRREEVLPDAAGFTNPPVRKSRHPVHWTLPEADPLRCGFDADLVVYRSLQTLLASYKPNILIFIQLDAVFPKSAPKNIKQASLTLSICPNGRLALLLFMQSLAIHRHEEVIQRLSQRGMCKDAVANNGIRQLPHHGDLQYRHHFPAFHAKDRAT